MRLSPSHVRGAFCVRNARLCLYESRRINSQIREKRAGELFRNIAESRDSKLYRRSNCSAGTRNTTNNKFTSIPGWSLRLEVFVYQTRALPRTMLRPLKFIRISYFLKAHTRNPNKLRSTFLVAFFFYNSNINILRTKEILYPRNNLRDPFSLEY